MQAPAGEVMSISNANAVTEQTARELLAMYRRSPHPEVVALVNNCLKLARHEQRELLLYMIITLLKTESDRGRHAQQMSLMQKLMDFEGTKQ